MMKKIIKSLILLFAVFYSMSFCAQSNEEEFQQLDREIRDSIYSKTLDAFQHFWVKLPENYNPKNKAKYPVVYMLDGFSLQSSLEVVYDNYWGHYLPQMILVGISNRSNRTRDLTISKIETRRGSSMQTESGGAEQFTTYIETDLLPHIEKTFQTSDYRTIIGHSYAGLFVINTLVNHAHLFTNFIAIDPSIEWDNQKILVQAKEVLKTENFKNKGLFIALAAEQLHMYDHSVTINNLMEDTSEFSLFSRSIVEFSQYASSQEQNNLRFMWKVYPEDLHGTVPLPAIRDGLVFLFEWFQFKYPQKYNNPDTSVEELYELLSAQEVTYTNNFGYKSPPMVEELFNGYGYMNLQMQQPKKAYLFFSMALKYYPKSANAYDAMSDYYLSQKNNLKAIEYLNKAYEISKSVYHKEKLDALKSN
jgi:predicted alpha/beta superfamily hydrolase